MVVLGLLLPASLAGRTAALAQDTLRAVAVVNDDVLRSRNKIYDTVPDTY